MKSFYFLSLILSALLAASFVGADDNVLDVNADCDEDGRLPPEYEERISNSFALEECVDEYFEWYECNACADECTVEDCVADGDDTNSDCGNWGDLETVLTDCCPICEDTVLALTKCYEKEECSSATRAGFMAAGFMAAGMLVLFA